MIKSILVVSLFVAFNSLGCSQKYQKLPAYGHTETPLRESRIFNAPKLQTGGSLLVVPFSAGPGVPATDDLDRAALMIVKGIADVLAEKNSIFKLATAENAQNADLVIKGRIGQMQSRSGFIKSWGKKSVHLTFAVEGSILGVDDDAILAKFTQVKEFNGKDVRFEALAYETGVEIGYFLISASN